MVVRRCALIGLDLPTEPTTGHIVNVLINKSGAQLSPSECHSLLLDFKRKLKVAFKSGPGEVRLTDFPIDPRDMPPNRFEFAYKASPPVPPESIPATAVYTNAVPLRRTSSTLRPSTSSSSCSSLSTGAPQATDQLQQFAQILLQAMAGNVPPVPNLQLFKHNQRRASISLMPATVTPALMDKPSTEQHMDNADEQPTPLKHDAAHTPPTPATPTTPARTGSSMFQLPSVVLPPEVQSKVIADALANRAEAREQAKEEDASNTKQSKVKQQIMKRPAASVSKGKKGPAAAATHTPPSKGDQRPKPPSAGQTVHYAGGKLHRSDRLQAWRVFIRAGDRCDKAFILL